ncbi:MAG: hypothetical protein AB8C95_13850 [Phycisphaeraceae bacterium]
MFKHRCSYMVYSQAFEAMPDLLKEVVAKKLNAVLKGEDDPETFAHLGEDERDAILAILIETGVLEPSDSSD